MGRKKKVVPVDLAQQGLASFFRSTAADTAPNQSDSESEPTATEEEIEPEAPGQEEQEQEPPPAKVQKLEDLTEAERKNVEHYQKTFTWLEYLKPGVIRCSTCHKYQKCHDTTKPTNWSSGYDIKPPIPTVKDTGNWRANFFHAHEKSVQHAKAVKTPEPPRKAKLESVVEQMFAGDEAPTKRVIAIVLFTIQQEMPILKATSLQEFMVTIFSDEAAGLIFARHKSNWSTYQFMNALDADVLERQMDRLRSSVSYTLHADESTDISDRSFLLLYVQYVCVDESGYHKVYPTEFLTVIKVPNKTAQTITERILVFLKRHKIPLERMVMFTSDGANVMLGKKTGVAARLRKVVGAHLLDYHCVSHREALAMRHAYEKIDEWKKMDADLRSIISYLSQGKQRTGIERICEVLETEYVEIPKIFDIRWLSRGQAINAIIRDYSVIRQFLENQSNNPEGGGVEKARAKGFFDAFRHLRRIWLLHRLADLLDPFQFLMTFSQKRGMHPYLIKQHTETVINELRDRYSFDDEGDATCWDGDAIQSLKAALKPNGDQPPNIIPAEPEEEWADICRSADRVVVKLALKLITELDLRCGDQTESNLLKDSHL